MVSSDRVDDLGCLVGFARLPCLDFPFSSVISVVFFAQMGEPQTVCGASDGVDDLG